MGIVSPHKLTPDVLQNFRLIRKNIPEGTYRESLDASGIPGALITELYTTHAACRRRLAELELNIYYSLIPKLDDQMQIVLSDLDNPGSAELMSWQGFVKHIINMEIELNVSSSRGPALQEKIEVWKKENFWK